MSKLKRRVLEVFWASTLALALAVEAEERLPQPLVDSQPLLNYTFAIQGRNLALPGPPARLGPNATASAGAATSLAAPAPWRALLQTGLKVAAVGSSYLQHVSPFWSIRTIQKVGSVGEKSPAPYVALACNCAHWCSYGLLGWRSTGDANSLVPTYGNMLGSVLGAYYTAVYWRSCDDDRQMQSMKRYMLLAALLVAFEVVVVQLAPATRALHAVGVVCTALSVSVSASPLLTARTVLRTRSVESMPVHLALASLAAGALWTLCGLVLSDAFVIATNTVNVCASCLSLGLILRFHPRTRWFWESKELASCRELDDWTSGVFLRAPLNLEQLP